MKSNYSRDLCECRNYYGEVIDVWSVLQGLQTALHLACDWNCVACAELLISKGADINIKDKVYIMLMAWCPFHLQL